MVGPLPFATGTVRNGYDQVKLPVCGLLFHVEAGASEVAE